MLGFRSNKLWKKIISVIYLVTWAIVFLVVMFDGKYKNITVYDFVITKIMNIVVMTIFVSPYIFLSKTKFRQKLPLFKANKKILSIIGIILVDIILLIVFGIINMFHSQEYLADMANHDYTITAQKDATCETDGEIDYLCNYCGLTKHEVISALGHDMKEVSKTGASCDEKGILVEKCDRCEYVKETELSVLGHSMKEISKKDATCEKDGLLSEKCDRCGYVQETVLTAKGHTMIETSNKKATCEENGIISKKCEKCGHTEETVLEATGHNMKEVSRKQPTETTDGNVVRKCSVCGKEDIETIRRLGKTEEEYKAECKKVSYNDIARNPDNYVGNLVVFNGKVIQVQESGKHLVIRLNVTRGDYGIWEDTVYVEYTKSEGESRILEEDIVNVYGELNGIKTYTAVLGNSISIPHLKAKYIDIN